MDRLQEKITRLPRTPGVYLLKDKSGRILYVGKASDLRARVRSYTQTPDALSHKTRVLMGHAVDLDYMVTDTEVEALLLESNLIKEHNPRFNIILRDDKSYPYIKVTLQEDFPRVFVTRRVADDGARYFGPYTHVKLLRRNLKFVQELFPVRSCRYALLDERPDRPCLDYHIDRCEAPCVGYVSQAEYRSMIDDVMEFLAGRVEIAGERLEKRMHQAAERLQFERAAGLRRQLVALNEIRDRQRVSELSGDDRDVVGLARDGDEACGIILRVRDGRVMGKEHHVLGNVSDFDDGDVLSLFMTRYYLRADRFPRRLLAAVDFEDRPLIEEAVAERRGGPFEIFVPQRGEKARQVELAVKNARFQLEERRLRALNQTERASDAVIELKESLSLRRVPREMACVDISTIQGVDSVGSVVTFRNGAPRKSGYRKFRVQYADGQDDFAMMAEVVERYFKGLIDHEEALPDLLVIDGGRGQLNAGLAVLEELGVDGDLDVVGLAKREEELYLPDRKRPVWLPRRSRALQVVQHLRNEAHRFAVSYHRSLHSRRQIGSELDDVPGIGPKRRAALLHHFRSVDRLREIPVDEIAKVPGFSVALAERVKEALE